MRAFFTLALSVVLLLTQLAIVLLGLFAPHVSPQYRAFFIDHTTQDWVREQPTPGLSLPLMRSP